MEWQQWGPTAVQLVLTLVIIPIVSGSRRTREELVLLRYQVGLLMAQSGINPPSQPSGSNVSSL